MRRQIFEIVLKTNSSWKPSYVIELLVNSLAWLSCERFLGAGARRRRRYYVKCRTIAAVRARMPDGIAR